MRSEKQRRYLTSLFENAPSFTFLGLFHITDSLRIAGAACAVLAAIVLVAFALRRIAPHPILLGLNIFMLLASPAIELAFASGRGDIGDAIVAHLHLGIMGTVFLTGLVLTAVSPRGFTGMADLTRHVQIRQSAKLLAVAAVGVCWAILFEGQQYVAIGIPLLALFTARQFLLAGIEDAKLLTATGGVVLAEPDARKHGDLSISVDA